MKIPLVIILQILIRSLKISIKEKILKKKQDFYSGVKAAKESLKENDELNTETLAEIFKTR